MRFLFSIVLGLILCGSLVLGENLRSDFNPKFNYKSDYSDFEFTDKKDLTKFINSYFNEKDKLFTQEYWAGEIEIGPVTVYPNYKVF